MKTYEEGRADGLREAAERMRTLGSQPWHVLVSQNGQVRQLNGEDLASAILALIPPTPVAERELDPIADAALIEDYEFRGSMGTVAGAPVTHDEKIDDRIFAALLRTGQLKDYDDLMFPAELRRELLKRNLRIVEAAPEPPREEGTAGLAEEFEDLMALMQSALDDGLLYRKRGRIMATFVANNAPAILAKLRASPASGFNEGVVEAVVNDEELRRRIALMFFDAANVRSDSDSYAESCIRAVADAILALRKDAPASGAAAPDAALALAREALERWIIWWTNSNRDMASGNFQVERTRAALAAIDAARGKP